MNRPMPQPRGTIRLRGFTLIEMVTVMGLVALFMTIAVPAFVQIGKKAPFRQAAIDLQDGLAAARAQAILQGVSTEFVITAETGHMSINRLNSQEGQTINQSTQVSPWGQSKFDAYFHPEVGIELLDVNGIDQMDTSVVRVRFHPNGTCDEFAIVIKSLEGERRMIKLDIMTGRAESETDPNKFLSL